MEFHLHVQSRPHLSLLHTLERGSAPVAIFRLRLSEARRPLTYTPSGDIHIPDGAVLLERRVTLEELPSFLHPTQARKRIFEMLCFFLRGFPVTVRASTFHEWVAQVSDSVASSAAKALCVASCSVTADVHICRLPEEGTGVDGLGRVLLASTEAYEREVSFGSLPALEAAIEELETTAYAGEGEDGCVICYEEFVPRQEVKKMPCGHLFHGGCIVPWLRRSHKCPLCRFEMPKEEAASAV